MVRSRIAASLFAGRRALNAENHQGDAPAPGRTSNRTTIRLAATIAFVSAGSEPPNSANIGENRGMKYVSRNTRIPVASTDRIAGYSIAEVTLSLRSCSRARNVAICSSTTSRNPPVSPARTMAT